MEPINSNKEPVLSDETLRDVNSFKYDQDLIWFNIFCLFVIHASGVYGLFFGMTQLKTVPLVLFVFYGTLGGIGITAGAHRYWTHRSFKANLPLRIILMLLFSSAGQWRLENWVREHRLHHKFSETIYDPVNAKRGFFYAHCGFLMKKKHPLCEEMNKTIDVSDVLKDPVAHFFDKNFYTMISLSCFILPTMALRFVFEVPWQVAILCTMFRYMAILTGFFFVNSLAHNHMLGNHPYNNKIGPTDSLITAMLSHGEGWHNFHHTFPWDYRCKELGFSLFALPTHFIHFFAWLGWAYDLKSASNDLILRQAVRKGDGSRFVCGIPFVDLQQK